MSCARRWPHLLLSTHRSTPAGSGTGPSAIALVQSPGSATEAAAIGPEPVASTRRRDVSPVCLLLLCHQRLFLGRGMQKIPPSTPETATASSSPPFAGCFGRAGTPRTWLGGANLHQPPAWKLEAVPPATPPTSRSIAPQSSPSALAESLETILPTCTPELSELFKDRRIFLLHSRITWLANAGRLAAAAAPTAPAAAGGWGTTGRHPRNQLFSLQQGLVTGTSPSGTPASRKARLLCPGRTAVPHQRNLLGTVGEGGEGEGCGLCYR